jgi:hypothetical protein
MKSINFKELKKQKVTTGRIILASILVIASLVFTFLFFTLDQEYKKYHQAISSLLSCSFLLFTVGKMIKFPNYVGWSANSISIRLGFWKFPKGILFNEVIEVTQSKQEITFWKRYDEQIRIDLTDFGNEDIQQLKQILQNGLRDKAHFQEKPSWIQSEN